MFRALFLAACLAAVAGLLFGYDTGVSSAALLFVRPEFGLGGITEGWVARR